MNGHKTQWSREPNTSSTVQTNFSAHTRRRDGAFSLIELLVVIAIIAILAAIIFPAFSAAQENARENNTMAHLHDIASGLGMYKLDNKAYPPVLFAYACDADNTDGCRITDTMATIASDSKATNELVGLYPEYVRDWHEFMCQNDPVDDPNGSIPTVPHQEPLPNYLQVDGTLKAADGSATAPWHTFFIKDAFDVGPRAQGTNRLVQGSTTSNSPKGYDYVVRYQTSWTSWDGNYDPSTNDGTPFWASYQRQLAWQNPPANTYVTGVTDHIPNANRLLVLYESGTAQKVNLQLGSAPLGWDEAGSTGITPVVDSSGCQTQPTPASGTNTSPKCDYVPAGFWQYDHTGR